MHDAQWGTVLKLVRNQSRGNAIIQGAVQQFCKSWMFSVSTVWQKKAHIYIDHLQLAGCLEGLEF